jgi:hypothetical protein
MNLETGRVLTNVYYDPAHPASFSGVNKLYDAVKKFGINSKSIEKWLESQSVWTRHRRRLHKFKRYQTFAYGVDDRWQCDLGDMSKYAKHNDGYKFILVCIDISSRFAFCEPLKSKSAQDVLFAIKNIFQTTGRKPKTFTTDQGKEFKNRFLKNFLKLSGVRAFTTTTDEMKCAIAERLIRTLKDRIYKYMNSNNTFRWVDQISNFTHAYNNSVHRMLKMSPATVCSSPENQKEAHYNLFYANNSKNSLNQSRSSKYKVGDFVRIARKKEAFEKGSEPNFSSEIFKIVKKNPGAKTDSFKLNDLNGEEITSIFYPSEIVRVRAQNLLKQ